MNALLYTGCALGGAAAGLVLYGVAARTRPAPPRRPGPPGGDDRAGDLHDEADRPGLEDPATGAPADRPATNPVVPVSEVPASAAAPERSPAPPTSLAGRLLTGAVTGALCLAAALRFGAVPALAPYAVLFCGLVALSVADLRVGLLPRRILYPTLALVVAGLVGASAAGGTWHDLWVAAACGAVAFTLFFGLWYFFPRGMGFGDVRLAGLVGVALGWLGPLHLYLGLLSAFVVGTVFGLAVMAARGTGRRTKFPFGPSLAAGCVIGVLWGGALIHAWLGHGN